MRIRKFAVTSDAIKRIFTNFKHGSHEFSIYEVTEGVVYRTTTAVFPAHIAG